VRQKKVIDKASSSAPKGYGLHLLADGYGADPKKLSDVHRLYKTLNSLPEIIGMTKVGFPHIIEFTKPPIAGISGFVFIVESHISIHTYSGQGFISIDIYSCREFKPDKALQFLRRSYSITKMDTQLIKRGKHFRP